MKKIDFVMGICLLCVFIAAPIIFNGCASNGKLATAPNQVDWAQTAKYYDQYVMGFAIPVGGAIAVSVAPETAPLVSLAAEQAGKLDQLINSKASGESIASQAAIVQEAIKAVNAAVK